MAVVIESFSEDENGSGGDVVLAAPSGMSTDDLRVHVAAQVLGGSAPASGSGMTDLDTPVYDNSFGMRGQWILDSTSSITHTTPGSDIISFGVGVRVSGVDTSDPINAALIDFEDAATSGVDLGTITTDVDGCTILYIFSLTSGTRSPDLPSGLTSEFTSWDGGAGDIMRVCSEVQATAGATTARTVTWSGGGSESIKYTILAIAPDPGDAPSVPTSVSATDGDDEESTVTWTDETDGDPTATYRIEHNIDSAGFTLATASVADGVETYTKTGLTNGETVIFRIRAENTAGNSAWVTLGSITPADPASAPSTPATPTVVAGEGTALIDWVAPSDGGSAITGYKIERKVGAGSYSTLVADTGDTLVWYRDGTLTNGTGYQYRVSAINAIGTSGASSGSTEQTPAAKTFATSTSGRFIHDQNGDPWLARGDAGVWPQNLTVSEWDDYLDQLVTDKFNLGRVKLIEAGMVSPPTLFAFEDVDGEEPWTGAYYTSSLNAPFWDRWARLVTAAEVRGITMQLTPVWGGITTDQGTATEMVATSDAVMETFAENVADYFSDNQNVWWLVGGDSNNPSSALQGRFTAVHDGIANTGAGQLVSVHGYPQTDPDDYEIASLDDIAYFYDNQSPESTDYARNYAARSIPIIFGEGVYENEGTWTRLLGREQVWESFCEGFAGAVFGNLPRYHFAELTGTFGGTGTLADSYTSDGTEDFKVWADVVDGLGTDWADTAPDTTDTFLTSGTGIARFGDDLGVVYLSTGAATLDLTELVGSTDVTITRHDPTSGATSALTASDTDDSSYSIASQGNNADGASDWVFIVQGDGILPATDVAGTPTSSSTSSDTATITATATVAGTPTSSASSSDTATITATAEVTGTPASSATTSAQAAIAATAEVAGTAATSATTSTTATVTATATVTGTAASSATTSDEATITASGAAADIAGTPASSATTSATAAITATAEVTGTGVSSSTSSDTATITATATVAGTAATSATTSATADVGSVAITVVAGTPTSSATTSATASITATAEIAGTPTTSTTTSDTATVSTSTTINGVPATSATTTGTATVTATAHVNGVPATSATTSATADVAGPYATGSSVLTISAPTSTATLSSATSVIEVSAPTSTLTLSKDRP